MIRRLFQNVRRAPARILTSVLALGLAVAAIGVFAIPTVAASSLRDAARRDGVANLIVGTTDTGDAPVVDIVGSIDNVDHVELQVVTEVPVSAGGATTLVGVPLGDQQLDIVRPETGRLPIEPDEVIAPAADADIGDRFDVVAADGSTVELEVVGNGGTTFFDDSGVAFTTVESAAAIAGLDGGNRVVVRAIDDDEDALRVLTTDVRTALAEHDIALTYLPITIENGIHPVEQDIEQVSFLIGLLGIVAGIVGLVLLASTTNTLITERSREVAVMRALGATPRALRRRLRRLALGIALAAVIIGLPLGVLISNVIARMVLQEFVGVTPDLAVSIPVMAASAAFALIGARIVAARSARRVTNLPLAEALRDRDGAPFGRRWSERLVARWNRGGLLGRSAVRSSVQRRARSVAIAAQIGAAVSALLIVASMATTINDFNAAELDPWRWTTSTHVAGPGLDIDAAVAAERADTEAAIEVAGEALDWEVDVYGFGVETAMVDRAVVDGAWFSEPGDAVVSRGFAEHVGLDVGDSVEITLSSGPHTYEIVGLHANRGREFYTDRADLAADLGDPGRANRLLSFDPAPDFGLPGVVGMERFDALSEDDSGRQAILLIFGAIGLVVVAVAGLAVMSGLAVNVFERRHEFAAVQAIGGRRRHVFRLVMAELGPLAAAGLGLGLVGGYFGGRAVARSFETSNAVEIGFTFATGAVPIVAATVVAGSTLLALTMVRGVTRRPVAVTLRTAT